MTTPRPWQPLGAVPPGELLEARQQSHHALQLVSSVGRSLLPAATDDGHTSVEWTDRGLLSGPDVSAATAPLRAALQLDPLALCVLVDGVPFARLPLAGRAVDEARAWLGERLRDAGGDADRMRFAVPYRLPAHPVADGARFAPPVDGSDAEIARFFANADGLLRELRASWPGASPVRIWPHHFDAGVVLPLLEPGGEEARSIGAGFSPGDETIPEPYFYVTPWPPPRGRALPDLPAGGRWQETGWTGAALTATELLDGEGQAQEGRARAFLRETVRILRSAGKA